MVKNLAAVDINVLLLLFFFQVVVFLSNHFKNEWQWLFLNFTFKLKYLVKVNNYSSIKLCFYHLYMVQVYMLYDKRFSSYGLNNIFSENDRPWDTKCGTVRNVDIVYFTQNYLFFRIEVFQSTDFEDTVWTSLQYFFFFWKKNINMIYIIKS